MEMTKEEHEYKIGHNQNNDNICLRLELPSVDNSIHQVVSVKLNIKKNKGMLCNIE